MASPLANAVEFFKEFGLFDVILPFVLVFSVIFAILEKTRILGTEDPDGKIPRKNLNSMVAVVFAFLVVATNKIVNAINLALPNIVLLIVLVISFLLIVGLFYKTEEMEFSKKYELLTKWMIGFLLFFTILIFLGSIQTDSGDSWLGIAWDYASTRTEGPVVTSLIFVAVAVIAIIFITTKPKAAAP